MARVRLSIDIDAAPERIWPIISDLHGQEHWMEDVHKLEVIFEPPNGGAGAVIKVTSRLFGLPLVHDVMVVTRLEPPRLLEVVHCGQFSGWGAFRLQPAQTGTTFVWEEKFKPPFGALGEVAAARLVGPHLSEVWRRSMLNVKRLAEAGRA
jgi:uncharacterized protein YndB with AHSA1/START domain